MQDLKIVRILWGENAFKKLSKDIIGSPKFKNETVYVLGEKNYENFKSLGYDCVLLDKNYYIHPDINGMPDFSNKIYILSKIEEIHNEYLFLDWDVRFYNNKNECEEFYNLIRNNNSFEIPLYSYPNTYKSDMMEDYKYYLHKEDKELLEFKNNINNIIKYTIKQDYLLHKHGWKYLNNLIIPCFCYVYSNNIKMMNELYNICLKYNIETIADEFSFMIWLNLNMDDYINNYEPLVIRGREPNSYINKNLSKSYIEFNSYIDTKINKNIYLIHQ